MNDSKVFELFSPYIGPKRLNLGCAGNSFAGWDNLDLDPAVKPDIICKLGSEPVPVPDNTYDTVFASHVLEHIPRERLISVMYDLYRILKPGGFLIAITPYGSSDDAWENPHHMQCFTEGTYAYFCKRLYELPNTSGYRAYEGGKYGDWTVAYQGLVPYPEFRTLPEAEIEYKKRHLRNVIQELQVVMVAHKGES